MTDTIDANDFSILTFLLWYCVLFHYCSILLFVEISVMFHCWSDLIVFISLVFHQYKWSVLTRILTDTIVIVVWYSIHCYYIAFLFIVDIVRYCWRLCIHCDDTFISTVRSLWWLQLLFCLYYTNLHCISLHSCSDDIIFYLFWYRVFGIVVHLFWKAVTFISMVVFICISLLMMLPSISVCSCHTAWKVFSSLTSLGWCFDACWCIHEQVSDHSCLHLPTTFTWSVMSICDSVLSLFILTACISLPLCLQVSMHHHCYFPLDDTYIMMEWCGMMFCALFYYNFVLVLIDVFVHSTYFGIYDATCSVMWAGTGVVPRWATRERRARASGAGRWRLAPRCWAVRWPAMPLWHRVRRVLRRLLQRNTFAAARRLLATVRGAVALRAKRKTLSGVAASVRYYYCLSSRKGENPMFRGTPGVGQCCMPL